MAYVVMAYIVMAYIVMTNSYEREISSRTGLASSSVMC